MDTASFWKTYTEHKEYIDRIFNSQYSRFPSSEGKKDAYNDVITFLQESNIFDGFDPKKIVVSQLKKATVKKGETYKESEIDISDETFNALGIDINQKWYEYVGRYIRKRLSAQYAKRGLHSKRYIKSDILIDYKSNDYTSWMQTQEEIDEDKVKIANNKTDRRRFCPSHGDTDYYLATHIESSIEDYSAKELDTKIHNALQSDRINVLIYDYTVHEGMNQKDVAEMVGMSSRAVFKRLLKIRNIASRICS